MIIAAGRPGISSLNWWVLSEDGSPPDVVLRSGEPVQNPQLRAIPLPTQGLPTPYLVVSKSLIPDTPYSLSGGGVEAWSRTLPKGPLPIKKPFTIAFTSCYCIAKDTGIAAAYPPPRHTSSGQDPIRLRFLGGDQIYMDLNEKEGDVLWFGKPKPDVWPRYMSQWRAPKFRDFLAKSPNLALADDHEFWNDYPHRSQWLTWSERGRTGPQALDSDAAFSSFQAALNVNPLAAFDSPQSVEAALKKEARTFEFKVPPLSFFVLDTRTRRELYTASKPRFTLPAWREELFDWLRDLTGPGILILAQPMIEDAAGWFSRFTHTMGDVNLPDYRDDFAALWNKLFEAKHDVLVVSGDIHWSRVNSVTKEGSPGTVYEVISSPLARIPELLPPWVTSALGMRVDIHEPSGKVEWKGGRAYTGQRYATDEAPTYTTLSFTPQGGAGASVLVESNAWNLAGNVVKTDSFYLNARRP